MDFKNGFVNYEAFGAKGDGVTDDMHAICAAHAYANAHGLAVCTKPDATYYIGGQKQTCVIATDTDWNSSRFIIDDTNVEDYHAACFNVCSQLAPQELKIEKLTRDQAHIDVKLEHDCYILVENAHIKKFIRFGLNQDKGTSQHDCFVLRKDGAVDSPIDWDYDVITTVDARPIDETTLYVRGGILTTIANRMHEPVGYHYWRRNILITRSNTVVDGLTHMVTGETDIGCPYQGFISTHNCAFVLLRNCFATGHKIYQTIGSLGKPVSMGTYDYDAFNVVGFTMLNCRMNDITDQTRWGVIESSFCKNVLLEDCCLNRMDTHMGISGSYTLRRCTLGWQGLNVIGRGLLTIEDSTSYASQFISLRSDYGSTWEGDIVIRNCRWIPTGEDSYWPFLFLLWNNGMHDFGYLCSMPREVRIDGLFVDDSHAPADYDGMYFFTDPASHYGDEDVPTAEERPFPYGVCQQVKYRHLMTTSGFKAKLSPNADISANTVVSEEE